jgi:hypothetical protein
MLARQLSCCLLCARKLLSEMQEWKTVGKWQILIAAHSFRITNSPWTLFYGLTVTLLSYLDFQFRLGA